jgi:hypothetical protein
LNNPNREAWPLYEDDHRKPCLRETEQYKHLLFNFLKQVLLNSDYRKDSASKVLSDYVDTTLEAFLVLTYVNSYGTNWTIDSRGRQSRKLFKRWNDDGIELYNELVEVIGKQRNDISKPQLARFEKDLLRMFVEAKKGACIAGSLEWILE